MMRSKCIVIGVLLYFFSSHALKADDYTKAFEALERGDYKTATYYLSFFASNGDSVAQYNMGILYRDGLGVEKIPKSLSHGYTSRLSNVICCQTSRLQEADGDPHLADRKKGRLHFLKEAAFRARNRTPRNWKFLLLAAGDRL